MITGLRCPNLSWLRTVSHGYWLEVSELGMTSDSIEWLLAWGVRTRLDFGQFRMITGLRCPNLAWLRTAPNNYWLEVSELGMTLDSSEWLLAWGVRTWHDFGQLRVNTGLRCPNLGWLRTAPNDYWLEVSELDLTSDSSAWILSWGVRTWDDFGQDWMITGLRCPNLS